MQLTINFIMLLLVFDIETLNYPKNNVDPEPSGTEIVKMENDVIDDSVAKLLLEWSKEGQIYIEDFFQRPFTSSFTLKIHPNRKSLDNQWQQHWGYPDFESQCWMVASGEGSRLDILSMRVWSEEACEHNPNDTLETRKLFIHEMVHTFHGQNNPSPSFDRVINIDWLIEGMAVYVSGQLDEERLDPVKKMVKNEENPKELSNFWKGNSRYGLAGSMVAYIDHKYGRRILSSLLELTTADEALQELKISETELIDSWQDWILSKTE